MIAKILSRHTLKMPDKNEIFENLL